MYRILNTKGQLIFITNNLRSASMMYHKLVNQHQDPTRFRVMKNREIVEDVNSLFRFFP